MKVSDIAKAHGVSVPLVYFVINGDRKTTCLGLAMDVAKITGKLPIEHVAEKFQEIALKAHPKLGKPVKQKSNHKRKVAVTA